VEQQHVKIKLELVTPERTPTGATEIEPGVIEHGATENQTMSTQTSRRDVTKNIRSTCVGLDEPEALLR
jgi:hypothetical protein